MKTKTSTINMLGILIVCLGCPLGAVPVKDIDLSALQPCLNEQAVALVRLDVTRVNVTALAEQFEQILLKSGEKPVPPEASQEADEICQKLNKAVQDFTAAGGKEIYAIFNMMDLPHFVIAVPIPAGADGRAIEAWLKENQKAFRVGKLKTQRLDSVVLVGLTSSVDMLLAMSPKDTSVWQRSLQGCGDTMLQLVLAPDANQRRVLVEMMPNLRIPGREALLSFIMQGIKWMGLGVYGSQEMIAQLKIQATDETQARSLNSRIKTIVHSLTKEPDFQGIPQFQEQVVTLIPKQRGEQLSTSINESQTVWLNKHFVSPMLSRIRSEARRHACGTNMSGIGKAVLIYANDHSDNLPSDLKTLSKACEMTPRGLICPSVGKEGSYVYRGKGLNCSHDFNMVIVYDRKENHEEFGGRNVLFLDTRVEWLTEKEFQKAIKKDNEYRKQKGLPTIPIEG